MKLKDHKTPSENSEQLKLFNVNLWITWSLNVYSSIKGHPLLFFSYMAWAPSLWFEKYEHPIRIQVWLRLKNVFFLIIVYTCWDSNPRPSDLIHDASDHSTMVSCKASYLMILSPYEPTILCKNFTKVKSCLGKQNWTNVDK